MERSNSFCNPINIHSLASWLKQAPNFFANSLPIRLLLVRQLCRLESRMSKYTINAYYKQTPFCEEILQLRWGDGAKRA